MVAVRRQRLIADAPPLLVLSAGLLLGAALLNPLVSSSREVRATVSAPPPLQAWIDATATGGTLNAPAGTYSGPVVISRPMVIDGKGAITIDGGGQGTVLTLRTSGASLRGLHSTRSGGSHDAIDSGLLIDSGSDNVIEGNTIDDVLFGITRQRANNNRIAHNVTGISFYRERGGHLVLFNSFEHNLWQALVGASGDIDGNERRENYWDNYEGFNRNDDGFGDTPYEIWAHADQIWLETPMARFFRNSPALELLDFLERLAPFALPTLILRDPEPVSRPDATTPRIQQQMAQR